MGGSLKRPSPAAQQKLVDAWRHPEGTEVLVRRDDGTDLATKTCSGAWLLITGRDTAPGGERGAERVCGKQSTHRSGDVLVCADHAALDDPLLPLDGSTR